MPSLEHEALVQLVQQQPALLLELLRAQGVVLPDVHAITPVGDTLRKLVPVELHADGVFVFEGPQRFASIVEVQRKGRAKKRGAWPVYVTIVHRQLGCPVYLVVVTDDERTARWCRRPIEVAPGFVLRPIVISPSCVPQIVDPAVAANNLELAVLSALMHAGRHAPLSAAPIAFAALEALHVSAAAASIDHDTRADYTDVVLNQVPLVAAKLLEHWMKRHNVPYYSEFAGKFYEQGRAEGVVQGEAKGRAEGETKGRAEGEAEAILQVLDARGIKVTKAGAARIRTCTDQAQLTRWIRRAVTITKLAELFDA